MHAKLTNRELRQLLLDLGFAKGEMAKNNHRVFEHPDSHCLIVLPDIRDEVAARAADVAGVRDHLDQHSHLDVAMFDRFVVEGKLSAA